MKRIKKMLMVISLIVAVIMLSLITYESIFLYLLSATTGLIFVWLVFRNNN